MKNISKLSIELNLCTEKAVAKMRVISDCMLNAINEIEKIDSIKDALEIKHEEKESLPPVEEQPKPLYQHDNNRTYTKEEVMAIADKHFADGRESMRKMLIENQGIKYTQEELDKAVEEAKHEGYKNGYGIGHKDGYQRAIEILQLQNH